MRCPWPILALLWASPGWGQYPLTRTFELQDGMRRPRAEVLAVGPDGLLWAGGPDGLFRTDGELTQAALPEPMPVVTALASDKDGVLVALNNGVILHVDGFFHDTLLVDTTLRRWPVTGLLRDASGSLWVGTYGAGICRLQGGTLHWLSTVNGLADDHVNALVLLPDGRVALATDAGVDLLGPDGSVVAHITETEGLPDNLVLSLFADAQGTLWGGTDRGGVFSIGADVRVARSLALDSAWAFGPVTGLWIDPSIAWLATERHGLLALDLKDRSEWYRSGDPSDGPTRVTGLVRSPDGALWWCTGRERVHRSDPDVLVASVHERIDLRRISALTTSPDGRVQFAIGEQVYSHAVAFADTAAFTKRRSALKPSMAVVTLLADATGEVWTGTMGDGVHRLTPSGADLHLTERDGLVNDHVLRIRRSGEALWMATLGGAARWTPHGGFTTMPVPGGGFLYDIMPLEDGSAIVASDGSGLIQVRPGSPGTPLAGPGPTAGPRSYYSLCRGADGTIWALGPGTGLCQVKDGAVRCVGRDHPVLRGEPLGVAPFRSGVAVFTDEGLLLYEPANDHFLNLGAACGLQGVDGELNAMACDAEGALWLATDQGLVRIRPELVDRSRTLKAAILGWTWGLEPLPLADGARLAHDQDLLTFQYFTPPGADPRAVRFEHRLVGYDSAVRTTRERQVTYARLTPGAYRFEVRPASTDGGAAHPWTGFSFTIQRPWWRRPWALGLWFIGIAMLLYAFIRLREERIRMRDRLEKDRVRFQLEALRSQVNPHFLFNSFNTLIELIEEEPHKAVGHVEQLSTFFRNILQVREHELIPVEEELRLLATYFDLEKRRFGDRIALVVNVDDHARRHRIVPLTLQLLVENALKHNAATTAEPLPVTVEATTGELVVRNPLRPREVGHRSTGYGLESIRQRYTALTDRPVHVANGPGTFEVRIPLIEPAP
ncbi:MAG TPA: histidine kinase [Flavobacteriales bacterium]|nr:histidine kinase [Flavobacteriales bacterium]HMR26393.1 histidine kinase [Flavobacteriales bacterium]